MLEFTETRALHHRTICNAVLVKWADVTAFLGHEHEGDVADDAALRSAIIANKTAPAWVTNPWYTDTAWIDLGWLLFGPPPGRPSRGFVAWPLNHEPSEPTPDWDGSDSD